MKKKTLLWGLPASLGLLLAFLPAFALFRGAQAGAGMAHHLAYGLVYGLHNLPSCLPFGLLCLALGLLFGGLMARKKLGFRLPELFLAALLSETKNTQGIFAVCRMERDTHALSALPGKGRLLAVENMQDPANLGAVLRTAEALGIAGVLLVGECCDIYSPKVLRASMGAVFRLPFYEAEDITVALAALHALGYTAYAAVPDAAARPIHTCCFTEGSAVFIGNEGNGLTEAARLGCDVPVTIPMQGRAESLNAAAAASIVMWELCRPRED